MITVIFKLKDHGIIKNYVRLPDDQMPDNEAFFDSNSKLLYVRESTFCAANAMYTYSDIDRRRARYTIAHEVGHIALGHEGRRFRGKNSNLAQQGRIRSQEREAERFAAAFLAPAHLAKLDAP